MTRPPAKGTADARRRRGAVAWASGLAAEEAVARHCEAQGLTVAHRRWRSPWGEVDLIARDGTGTGGAVVFVEVKRAANLDAAQRLSRRQMDRLVAAAQAFCAHEPRGLLTEMRFDLALVDGLGRVRVIENAFGEDF